MFAGGFFFFFFESGIQYFKKWCLKLSFFLLFSSERTPCFLWKVVFCVCYLGIYLFIFKSEFLVKLLSSRTWSFWGKNPQNQTTTELCGEAAAVGSFTMLSRSPCKERTWVEQGLPASPWRGRDLGQELQPLSLTHRRAPGQGEGPAGPPCQPVSEESLSTGRQKASSLPCNRGSGIWKDSLM